LETKPLKKIESLCQALRSTALPGGAAGLDVDFVHLTKSGWVVYEFLRAISVSALLSHPRRYWNRRLSGSDGNWRKFVTLWKLAKELRARFFLVNFEAKETETRTLFGDILAMHVDMSKPPSETNPIETRETFRGGLADFTHWFLKMNEEVSAKNKALCHYCQKLLPINAIHCQGCEETTCPHCQDESWFCERCCL
jgi:hypothetical protein